eukprot:gene1077-2106_t
MKFRTNIVGWNLHVGARQLSFGQRSIEKTHRLMSSKFPRAISDHENILSVAIVGRPNVGKSTLFNRLTGSKMAIVSDIPGTTRDRREGEGYLAGLSLKLIDTGGLDNQGMVSSSIVKQVEAAVTHADVVLFLVDARAGLNPLDAEYSRWLRKTMGQLFDGPNDTRHRPKVLLLANKSEGAFLTDASVSSFNNFQEMGLGDPIPVSAAHGDGMADLFQVLNEVAESYGIVVSGKNSRPRSSSSRRGSGVGTITEEDAVKEYGNGQLLVLEGDGSQMTSSDSSSNSSSISSRPVPIVRLEDMVIQLAFMGRPNVGKSTLINAILGDERVIVGPTPGLTRDAVQVEWSFYGRRMRLVDTAGLTHISPDRRLLCGDKDRVKQTEQSEPRALPGTQDMDKQLDPSQFSHRISEMSLVSALNALRFAQVVVLIVEASQGKFSKVDLQLARKCMIEGRAVVVVGNKSDLLPPGLSTKKYQEGIKEHCKRYLPELGEIPVVCCVALRNEGINSLLYTVIKAHDAWSQRIDTWVLNGWFKDLMVTMPPTRVDGRVVKIKYITQVKSRPPTFALFCNTSTVPGAMERFIRSKLQRDFSLDGVPLRFLIRKSETPAEYKTKKPKRYEPKVGVKKRAATPNHR